MHFLESKKTLNGFCAPSYTSAVHTRQQPIQLFNFLRFSNSAVAFSRVFRWRDSRCSRQRKKQNNNNFLMLCYCPACTELPVPNYLLGAKCFSPLSAGSYFTYFSQSKETEVSVRNVDRILHPIFSHFSHYLCKIVSICITICYEI